jgi:hypothetical protein
MRNSSSARRVSKQCSGSVPRRPRSLGSDKSHGRAYNVNSPMDALSACRIGLQVVRYVEDHHAG